MQKQVSGMIHNQKGEVIEYVNNIKIEQDIALNILLNYTVMNTYIQNHAA
jgi:hypothetical protein